MFVLLNRHPPRSPRTATLCPYTTRCRSAEAAGTPGTRTDGPVRTGRRSTDGRPPGARPEGARRRHRDPASAASFTGRRGHARSMRPLLGSAGVLPGSCAGFQPKIAWKPPAADGWVLETVTWAAGTWRER